MTDQVPGLSQPSQRAPFRRPTSTHPGPRSSTTAHRRLWRDAPGDVVARGQRHAGMTSSIAIRCRCARACVPDWGAAPSCVRPRFVTGDLLPHTVRTRFGRSRNSRRRVRRSPHSSHLDPRRPPGEGRRCRRPTGRLRCERACRWAADPRAPDLWIPRARRARERWACRWSTNVPRVARTDRDTSASIAVLLFDRASNASGSENYAVPRKQNCVQLK